jgi:hypothetical protein
MPWVEFTADYRWQDPRMKRRFEFYKGGDVRMVTTPCANAAIIAGRAKFTVRPTNERSDKGR